MEDGLRLLEDEVNSLAVVMTRNCYEIRKTKGL